jgi:hypothetical protein
VCAVVMLCCPCMCRQLHPCSAPVPIPQVVWLSATQLPEWGLAKRKEGWGGVHCCDVVW